MIRRVLGGAPVVPRSLRFMSGCPTMPCRLLFEAFDQRKKGFFGELSRDMMNWGTRDCPQARWVISPVSAEGLALLARYGEQIDSLLRTLEAS